MAQNQEQLPVEIGIPAGSGQLTPRRASAPRRDLNIVKKQPDIISRSIRPTDLLYALRRRWAVSLGLGLFVTIVTLFVSWMLIPVEYSAKVWLRFAKNKQSIIFNVREEESYLNDRNAQAALIRSSFVLNAALDQSGISSLPCLKNEKDPTNWLAKKLSVGYLNGSEILQISISGENPQELESILTAVRDAYMQEVVQVDRDAEVQRRNTLNRAYKNLKQLIDKKEIQYRNRAEQLGAADSKTASYASIYALESVSTLRNELNRLHTVISGMDQRIALLTARLQLYPEDSIEMNPEEKKKELRQRMTLSALAQDAEIMRMRNELINAQALLKQQIAVAKNPQNPSIMRLEAHVETLKQQIEARAKELEPLIVQQVNLHLAGATSSMPMSPADKLRAEIEVLKIDREVFQKELDSNLKLFQKEVASAEKLSSGSSELESMRNELDRMKRMYNQMGTQLDEWSVEQQAGARVSTINNPEADKVSNIARKGRMVGFLGVLSFFGTVIAVSGFDFLGRRVNSADELSFGLGLHVMGDLPLISRGFHRHRMNQSVQGLLMESIDNIRTALLHRAESENMKAVLITSSLEKEGKTTVSSQLSASLARTGKRVVLVDADLRRPSSHRMFDRPLNPGLAEYLRKKVSLDEVITTTRVENLWIIPAGTPHPEAIISLAQGGMEEPMRLLREQFDFIVVDSGPVLTDADVLVVGRLCDGVIVSVLRDVSRLPWVYEACERIRMVEIPLIGTVLNGVSFGKYRPYYSSYTIEVSSRPRLKRN
ncbi:MAG: polysaccharide biosynthesis tyrosine autokinase [Planctomycetia bacterium]|nr:polysaccharide biosynthesis tyrosine autokinase [Planctomycetia bacterium]